MQIYLSIVDESYGIYQLEVVHLLYHFMLLVVDIIYWSFVSICYLIEII